MSTGASFPSESVQKKRQDVCKKFGPGRDYVNTTLQGQH